MTMTLLLALALGYALGSIPFGLILTRLAGTEDIRTIGSGNIGATNVLRTGRKGLAAATLLGDALKGTVAVLLARAFVPALAGGSLSGAPLEAGAGFGADLSGAAALAAAVGAFLGHIAPVWLGFKGGKGVATFLGTLIAVSWIAAVAFAVLWLATAKLSRFSSLAALIASAATPLVLFALGWREGAAVYAVLAAILWWKHSANIGRLRAGTEGRIGAKG